MISTPTTKHNQRHSRAEAVSQLAKGEKMFIFRNGFTIKISKKFVVSNFNESFFPTIKHKLGYFSLQVGNPILV
jgi:hypothetical protein